MNTEYFSKYSQASSQLSKGHLEEALLNFNFLYEQFEEKKSYLWQRGLTLYFLGRYEEAFQQFDEDLKINGNDIEENIWRLSCLSRSKGLNHARVECASSKERILNDKRVFMVDLFSLFMEELSLTQFLDKLKNISDEKSLFYSTYYVALFLEINERKIEAFEYLKNSITYTFDLESEFMAKVALLHFKLRSNEFGKILIERNHFKDEETYSYSRILRGCWQLAKGHHLIEDHLDPSKVLSDLTRYTEAGITTFDCGDIYTGVEEILGKFIRTHRHLTGSVDKIQVHTKFVPDFDMLPKISLDYIRQVVQRSLNRLYLDKLDLVQFHWWDYGIPGYIQAAKYLTQLKEEGLISKIGLTNFDTVHLEEFVANGIPIVSNQVQYSLVDRRVEKTMIPFCQKHNIQLLCYGVLCGGFLTNKWLGRSEPSFDSLENRSLKKYKLILDDFCGWDLFQKLLECLQKIGNRYQVPIANVASRWVLQRQQVGGIIVGGRHPKHLYDNLAVFRFHLSEQDLKDIDQVLKDSNPIHGEVYELERDREGIHGKTMKYNLSLLNQSEHFEEICRRYVDLSYFFHPEKASYAGVNFFHPFISSRDSNDILNYLKWGNRLIAELNNINKALLDNEQYVDYELIQSDFKVETFELTSLKIWKNDPTLYLKIPFDGIMYLLIYSNPITSKRVNHDIHLFQRMKEFQTILLQAQRNLENPPRSFTEIAIKIVGELIPFFSEELASQYRKKYETNFLDSLAYQMEFESLQLSVKLKEYQNFLTQDLLNRSNGEIAIGRENYEFLLKEKYMLDNETVDSLLEKGKVAFQKIERQLEECAKGIDPNLTWKEITTQKIKPNHPKAENLLESYLSEIHRARSHFVEKGLFSSLSASESVIGIDTPEPLRPFSPFGDFLNPGAFSNEKTGILMLHPIPKDISEEEKEKLLRSHDYTWISVIAPHEVYPGHHLQTLKAQENPSWIRKFYLSPLFYEGWGLYTEELAYITGFFPKEREKETRLTQLRLQLWRAARVLLDIQLHTKQKSFEECCQFLQEHILFDQKSSLGEVNIYAFQPCYAICYLVGFQMVSELKQTYFQQKEENNQTAKEFYALILSKGSIPFKLLKKSLQI